MKCRHCSADLNRTFIDLGCPPPSNAYLTEKTVQLPEKNYPLKVLICGNCWLLQTEDFVGAAEMFSESYAYFSSFSSSWLEHAEQFVEKAVKRFGFGQQSRVVEVAANDGYLLQFVRQKEIPCYGIEPTQSTAMAAREKGIEIIEAFFGTKLARKLANSGRRADLLIANNVLAHVPDINDFAQCVSVLLKPDGVATFEFPHVMSLVKHNQFDTIYHEHFSYLSLSAVLVIFESWGLKVFDVENLRTHGGSLRVYAIRADSGSQQPSDAVAELKQLEDEAGITTYGYYSGFQSRAEKAKTDFLMFLSNAKEEGKKVVGYGAAAKGNTLLNFAGVDSSQIAYVADRNPAKQGLFMPGSLIPIMSEDYMRKDQPDYVVLFPWNLKSELVSQLEYIRSWGGRFVTAIPLLEIV